MAEQTMNKQLNGAEIVEAMVDKIRAKFRADCYLNPNSAYDWFTARISIELDMHDTGTMIQVNHSVEASHGEQPIGETEHVEGVLDIEAAAPNEVRRETGQPIPTLTKDPKTGKLVEKGVRYSRKGAAATAILLMAFAAGVARGQTAPALTSEIKAVPSPDAQRLSPSERLALQGVYDRNSQADEAKKRIVDDLRAIESDIQLRHPGYHFDEKSGQLVKNEAPKK